MGRRVLITGVARYPGSQLARILESEPSVEDVIGVDVVPPEGLTRTEFVQADIAALATERLLAVAEVDTVVHTSLQTNLRRASGRAGVDMRGVFGSYARNDAVTKIVVRSSSGVYGAVPGVTLVKESEFDRDLPASLEAIAEQRAVGMLQDRGDLTTTVLRLAPSVGHPGGRLTSYLCAPVALRPFGFDPLLQLVHTDDELEVLRRSVLENHEGTFNVAGDGVVFLSQALRILRRAAVMVPAKATDLVAEALNVLGLCNGFEVPGRFGASLDTSLFKSTFGYRPKFTTQQALRDMSEVVPTAGVLGGAVAWQRNVYERLISRLAQEQM